MKAAWKPVEWAECESCGSSDIEAHTTADKWYCYDGDPLRCVDCGATSNVHADGESGPWAGEWDDPPEAARASGVTP